MKTNISRSLLKTCFLAVGLLALPVAVQAQFTYTTNNGTITITGYTGSGGAVIIPDNIHGLPVVSIEDASFFNCFGLGDIVIPNSVTSIGAWAFADCYMANIWIWNAVTSVL